MARLKLFCFPYAGGSAIIFNKWDKYLDSNIELIPVELAGRGRRINDVLYKDLSEAVEDVFQIVSKEIANGPYALFGHSMGALIAYHLARRIRISKLSAPQHIFFSGRSAPHLKRSDHKKVHSMSDEDFKEKVIALGGTPPELFEHPELVEFFLPVLKCDFSLSETEFPEGEIKPLEESITVFLGKDDELTADQSEGWKEHTTQLCNIHHFDGGHFFLHDEAERMVKCINLTLM